MMNQSRVGVAGLVFLLLVSCGSLGVNETALSSSAENGLKQDAEMIAGELRRSGTIDLPVTCKPELKAEFETATALLHSFFYDEARRRFESIAERDANCAMAYWGIAMTHYHPLWGPPTKEERKLGKAAALQAQKLNVGSKLERGLIDAIVAFYMTDDLLPADSPAGAQKAGTVLAGCICCGPQAQGARALVFRDKLEQLRREFPDNVEVTVFYALSLLGTAVPTDKTYAEQRRAADILLPLFETNPDHPGVAHYIIHAYDYPELAELGLSAARKYADIAPWVPHALHMPSHIYTRLGMWSEAIESNRMSSSAARDHAARHYGGRAIVDDLHAMDYLAFAYLQTAQDAKALSVLDDLQRIEVIQPGNSFASAYAVAAIPARIALERRDWAAASDLELPLAGFAGDFPMAEAHIQFARAVGAARLGKSDAAETAIARLAELRDDLDGSAFAWWTDQVEIQKLASEGWLAHMKGESAKAESLFRRAAVLEDSIGTHPVTPGQILPVREQLGDLLLELGMPDAALVEYELSLVSFPRRFLSHDGAARAAAQVGDLEKSRTHYQALLTMAGDSTERLGVTDAARAALSRQ